MVGRAHVKYDNQETGTPKSCTFSYVTVMRKFYGSDVKMADHVHFTELSLQCLELFNTARQCCQTPATAAALCLFTLNFLSEPVTDRKSTATTLKCQQVSPKKTTRSRGKKQFSVQSDRYIQQDKSNICTHWGLGVRRELIWISPIMEIGMALKTVTVIGFQVVREKFPTGWSEVIIVIVLDIIKTIHNVIDDSNAAVDSMNASTCIERRFDLGRCSCV